MKVNYYEEPDAREDYADIHYRVKNRQILGIMDYFDSYHTISGQSGNIQKQILPNEIYYCEITDRKCYAYLETEVYQIDFGMQSLIDSFGKQGFVRIGKSMVVNLFKIDKLKMGLNMKVEIFLKNGENVILNRGYKKEFMVYLNQAFANRTGGGEK